MSPLILDGGMGSALIARGLAQGQPPERWNLERPEAIAEVQTIIKERARPFCTLYDITDSFASHEVTRAAKKLALFVKGTGLSRGGRLHDPFACPDKFGRKQAGSVRICVA